MKERVLEYIVEFMLANDYPPTVREIGAGVGLKSTSSVYEYLQRLQDEGRIDYEPDKPRTITVPRIYYTDERFTEEERDYGVSAQEDGGGK